MKKKITIQGMSCMHCVARVEKALADVGGKDVTVNLAAGDALGFFDASDDAIREAVEDMGFDVISIASLT